MLLSLSMETELILYWDRVSDAVHTVTVDGVRTVETDRTHVRLRDLEPDTAYTVRVSSAQGLVGECTVRTRPLGARVVVRDFGARGDGRTVDTAALQAAIDACPVGGTVVVPPGEYLTGALFLHSDMTLCVERGATLQGLEEPSAYVPKVPSRFEGTERMCYASLLNLGMLDHTAGPTCGRVLLTGGGAIRGGGRTLAERTVKADSPPLPPACLDEDGHLVVTNETVRHMSNRTRGRLIQIANAEDVALVDLSLENGPAWNVHPIYSRRVTAYACSFHSENVWNGDGFNPDSSEDCAVIGCDFHTGDDSVAIKSGKNPEGNAVGRPTRRVRIMDCVCASGHGLTVGSEMSGGVEDVRISDCDLRGTLYGVEIKGTWKRGGYVRGVEVTNCTMPRFLMHAVPYNNDGEPAPTVPLFEDCRLSGVTLTGVAHAPDTKVDRDISGKTFFVDPIEIVGFADGEHRVRSVVISDLTLERRADGVPHALRLDHLTDVTLTGVRTVEPRT